MNCTKYTLFFRQASDSVVKDKEMLDHGDYYEKYNCNNEDKDDDSINNNNDVMEDNDDNNSDNNNVEENNNDDEKKKDKNCDIPIIDFLLSFLKQMD